eukprot:g2335.t1
MSRSVASLIVKIVLSKWVKKFNASTLEVKVKSKELVLRNFEINTDTLQRAVSLPHQFRYESARCNYLKMTFKKWPTTAEALTKRIIVASFGILSIKIKFVGSLDGREDDVSGKRNGRFGSVKKRRVAETDDRFQRKLYRAIQLEARSVRLQLILPGGSQLNINVNGWQLYSTNSMWQRIDTLKHMFDVKHFKLLHISSAECRFASSRDKKSPSHMTEFGMFHNSPIEIKTTTEYDFDTQIQVPRSLNIDVRFALNFFTSAQRLRELAAWGSKIWKMVFVSDTNDDREKAEQDFEWFGRHSGAALRRSIFRSARSVSLHVQLFSVDASVAMQDDVDFDNALSEPHLRAVSTTPMILDLVWTQSRDVGGSDTASLFESPKAPSRDFDTLPIPMLTRLNLSIPKFAITAVLGAVAKEKESLSNIPEVEIFYASNYDLRVHFADIASDTTPSAPRASGVSSHDAKRSQRQQEPGCSLSIACTAFKTAISDHDAVQHVLVPILRCISDDVESRKISKRIFGFMLTSRLPIKAGASLCRQASFYHSILAVLRRAHVEVDILVQNLFVEFPANILEGAFTEGLPAHTSNIRLLRLRGKNMMLSNYYREDAAIFKMANVRGALRKMAVTSSILPLAMADRQRILHGKVPCESLPWPALFCFACSFYRIHGIGVEDDRLFDYAIRDTALTLSFETSDTPTVRSRELLRLIKYVLVIPAIARPSPGRATFTCCVKVGEWSAVVPPSQTNDFVSAVYKHFQEILSKSVRVKRIVFSQDFDFFGEKGASPNDIYALGMWQLVLASFCGAFAHIHLVKLGFLVTSAKTNA